MSTKPPEFDPLCGDGAALRAAYAELLARAQACDVIPPESGSTLLRYDGKADG